MPPIDQKQIETILKEELERLRADTPGVRDKAFLVSCGSSLVPLPVDAGMRRYLALEMMQGGYRAAALEAERLNGIYPSIARLLNASPDEVALAENATVAWQLAFHSIRFRPGDVVVSSEAEYGANYVALLQARERFGIEIRVCPSDETGEIDTAALERMIDRRVKLIVLTWIPTNGGLVNPAAEVGRIANAADVPYLLDACQAVGQLPVDVEKIGCDFLAGTSRKFLRGPRGAGFLYVRRCMLDRVTPPLIDHFGAPWVSRDAYELRRDARRYESWENNYVARLGMGLAVDYALAVGIERISDRCMLLAGLLRSGLSSLPGVTVRDLGRAPGAIVSFTLDNADSEALVEYAQSRGVFMSPSRIASTRLDAERRKLPVLVRAAPHYFNSEEEIERAVEVVGSYRG